MRYQNRKRGLKRSVSAQKWSEKLLLLTFGMLEYAQALHILIWSQTRQQRATKWTKNIIFTGKNWNKLFDTEDVSWRVFRSKMLCFMCFSRFLMVVEISIKDTTLLCLSSSHQVFCQGFITFHLPFHWTCWLKQPRKPMVRKYEMSAGRFSFNLVSIPNHRGESPKRPWFYGVFRVSQITVMDPGLRSWSPRTEILKSQDRFPACTALGSQKRESILTCFPADKHLSLTQVMEAPGLRAIPEYYLLMFSKWKYFSK